MRPVIQPPRTEEKCVPVWSWNVAANVLTVDLRFARGAEEEAEITREQAETIALEALAWVAAQGDMLEGFLHCTGASASGLAERAREPEFLAALLDFLMTDDAGIIGFSRSAGLAPEIIPAARAALPGGDLPNWT